MQNTSIPHTDLNLSHIALGTWVFGGDVWGGAEENGCIDAVNAALDHGINLIDTAPIYGYGQSEQIVGKAIKGKRDKFIIATKCGLLGKAKSVTCNLKPASIRMEIEESLKRLGTEYIDIYQCHWPDSNTPIEETLDAMIQLKEEGKIRYAGVSNFDVNLLRRAVDYTGLATLQNQYSLLERSIENEILPFIRQRGVGLISYGSLAGGILSGKYASPAKFKGPDARQFFYKYYSGSGFEKTQQLITALREIDRPLNQIAINWVRQQPGVTSVIVGCRNAEQLKQNAAAVTWDLTEKDLQRIKKSQSPNPENRSPSTEK